MTQSMTNFTANRSLSRFLIVFCMILSTPLTYAIGSISTTDVVKAVIALPLLHSVYTHFDTLPHTNPNRYSAERCKEAFVIFKEAIKIRNKKAIMKATKDLLTELNYFYRDGLCGHPSAVEGPHNHAHGDDHASKPEMVVISSRGVYGYIHSNMSSLTKACVTLYGIYFALEKLYKGENPLDCFRHWLGVPCSQTSNAGHNHP